MEPTIRQTEEKSFLGYPSQVRAYLILPLLLQLPIPLCLDEVTYRPTRRHPFSLSMSIARLKVGLISVTELDEEMH